MKNEEKAIFALREIFEKYGYAPYKMSKFEEYDLYVKNKDFLISDNIITFTDVSGKLMALKPDVTLSIIKNSKDAPESIQKVYYNENVYRVSKSTGTFKEIMQVGLECLGEIDRYSIFEVITLAAKSLKSISDFFVLDISHLGVLSEIIEGFNVNKDTENLIYKCIGEKNLHELSIICKNAGVPDEKKKILEQLISCYGSVKDVFENIKGIVKNVCTEKTVNEFSEIMTALLSSEFSDKIRIDFSVVNDVKYYNAIVFRGFVDGIPSSILSGGQYDKLMQKMHRTSGAIGFAVYLDMLSRLDDDTELYDVDVLLLYNEDDSIEDISRAVEKLSADGKRVKAARSIPDKITYRELVKR